MFTHMILAIKIKISVSFSVYSFALWKYNIMLTHRRILYKYIWHYVLLVYVEKKCFISSAYCVTDSSNNKIPVLWIPH